MKVLRLGLVIVLGFFGLIATAAAASAAPSWAQKYDCTGGNVPSGTYDSILIAGAGLAIASATMPAVQFRFLCRGTSTSARAIQ